MNKPVFYDPQRKRWKRLRRIFDIAALLGFLLLTVFVIGVVRMKRLPELQLAVQTHNYRGVNVQQRPVVKSGAKPVVSPHRKTLLPPSDVTLNTNEGLRAAYYVDDDAASYSSLKQHAKQIDLLFPEWLHVITPDGNMIAYSASDFRQFSVIDSGGVHGVDQENKVARAIAAAASDTEVFPLVNNYDRSKNAFSDSISDFLTNDEARARFVSLAHRFLAANPGYRGLTLDFEEVPVAAMPGYQALVAALYDDFHANKHRLYINTPVDDPTWDLGFFAAHSDGLVLMDYDEHQTLSAPGPIASQDWFIDNLQQTLKVVPKEKIILALGSYSCDWTLAQPDATPAKGRKKQPAKPAEPKVISALSGSTEDAWQAASDSGAQIEFDPDALNEHFAYDDEDAHVRHEVWFLDAATLLNEMRAARQLGIQTFSLWRLGNEDNSIWKIWDGPLHADPAKDLSDIPPGYSVDDEGVGDVLRVTRHPQDGHRTLTLDDDDQVPVPVKMITKETITSYPLPYTVELYGYHPKQVALSFDDGPDPTWTPKILDILRDRKVKGTFFMIGEVAQANVDVMKRVYREGHEIGNHTWSHPDISEISTRTVDLELNLTESLFGSKIGVHPLYFRPPYSIDQEPDTNDQAAPVAIIQGLGYTIVGNKVDTNDWDEHPRKSPQEITDSVLQQIADMDAKPWNRGSIILMHDGGGDRSATIKALPMLIDTLRAHGYEIVPVSSLLGLTRDQVMPALTSRQRWQARADSVAFFIWALFGQFVIFVFYVGDVLMSARLIIIGVCAIIDRLRKRRNFAGPDYAPSVAVLIPAYNEEKVIARTIRSVMMSNYKNLRIVVIDDGSKDSTYKVACEAYPEQIASGRLTVMTKPNGGKADALNYALEHIQEEIYIGIDADGVIATRCGEQHDLPLRQPEDRRGRGQRQGGQPREPVDAVAGARIHHEPEL